MVTTKVKIAELMGAALDWAVAQCENRTSQFWMNHSYWGTYSPSTNWSLAGPIIECNKIGIIPHGFCYKATNMENTIMVVADTMLVAAMRSYVASKFGYEIEVPKELL